MQSPINITSIQNTKRQHQKNNYRNQMNDTYATWRILKRESKTLVNRKIAKYQNSYQKKSLDNVPYNEKQKSNSLNKNQYKGLTLDQYFKLDALKSQTCQMIKNLKPKNINLEQNEFIKRPFKINQCQEENSMQQKKQVKTPQFPNNEQLKISISKNDLNFQRARFLKRSCKLKTDMSTYQDMLQRRYRTKVKFPTMGSQTNTNNISQKLQIRKQLKEDINNKRQKIFCSSILNLEFKQLRDSQFGECHNIRRYKNVKNNNSKRSKLNDLSVQQINVNKKYFGIKYGQQPLKI